MVKNIFVLGFCVLVVKVDWFLLNELVGVWVGGFRSIVEVDHMLGAYKKIQMPWLKKLISVIFNNKNEGTRYIWHTDEICFKILNEALSEK